MNAETAIRAQISPAAGSQFLQKGVVNSGRLWDYLCCILPSDTEIIKENIAPGVQLLSSFHMLSDSCTQSLLGLVSATEIYRNLEQASISLKILSEPLSTHSWLPHARQFSPKTVLVGHPRGSMDPLLQPMIPLRTNRPETFACIAKFESGSLKLRPEELKPSFAICADNSIYVAGVLLSDPSEKTDEHVVRRIVGNIGHTGICLLVAPKAPQIRSLMDDYSLVTHAEYDFKQENNFEGTSLHLSFTDWTFPLETGNSRTIDTDVHFVESVISVLDRGHWVADLDILGIDPDHLPRLAFQGDCPDPRHKQEPAGYVSIDSWEELLDRPEAVGIVRAHGNWVARLAAVSILFQKDLGDLTAIFRRGETCFKCAEGALKRLGFPEGKYSS